ncbi:bifunctional metallophosphatase/5'-nucleotidase [Methanosarcina sp.]|uniref:bifunctional metallophosphatase/5'-nucleotidase n=1 Tax=Methanosarcina sp. TaxID=2213 RepID=UPI00298920A5|nr:bifunctional metallophosphatase/5'-nucleotidase [Methanosarcina sp.]MDW5550848.1 bifunctional metallophosphatase/5'-nucleotidase [Methanosarcina sp.]MDW5554670.1 bifunctional metallophosphatase/5'-nucleotidase [Methanosarcina sp.]MDW5560457.1 bifunctional metallophosphatase/5'-nucleotidase [Methanosarcina sp.]
MIKKHNCLANKLNRHLALKLCLIILVSLASLGCLNASEPEKGALENTQENTVEVQILAINDLHGQLEPSTGKVVTGYNKTGSPISVDSGGMGYLAAHIKELSSGNPNTLVVSAGDSMGASPLLSALFHDEPTIKALNMMGLDFSAVGNHDLDEGVDELMRIQNGGCYTTDGNLSNSSFEGAHFQFLAANIVNESTNTTIFPAYNITYVQGIPIGFIGVALKDTPYIVTASKVKGLRFLDEVETINEQVRKLKSMGVKTIVVIIHDGGSQKGLYNESLNMSSPILNVINATDDEVDVFITGHTHQAYNAVIDGRLVTEAGSSGNLLTDIDLVISNETCDVIEEKSRNIIVSRDVPEDAGVSELIKEYKSQVAPLANRVIGNITKNITKTGSDSGESSLGDVIADAQLYATSNSSNGGAVIAFTNSGGIRADLVYNQLSGNELPGQVTYGEAFSVQPFGNDLVTMTLNGTQIDALLEQQFDNPSPGSKRVLQISKGFSYTWNKSAPTGEKVDISSIKINGTSIDPSSPYRVTVNSFLADGGDNFSVMKEGIDRTVVGSTDLDAFVDYLTAFSPIAPGSEKRIVLEK